MKKLVLLLWYKFSHNLQENLTYGLENGSILDLKMGYKTYHPYCTAEKRIKEMKKAAQCD